jgi:pyruvate dehydrogenase E2 component (dihydrolipoamide acetyltransferase)
MKVEPYLNAWYDAAKTAIIPSKALHVGLAVDTPDGLFVPVIRDADQQSVEAIRSTVERFKKEVPARTIASEELKGATITLSNFGTFAGRYATPMIVPPMVAIIGAGRFRNELALKDDKVVAQRILPLSLSFDHRAATGGEATRFLAAMIADLQLAH